MKKTIILCALILSFCGAGAQKKQNVYFLDKKGKEVKIKDSADFTRVIQEPDSGETNYVLYEFYMDDKKKTQGKISSFEPNIVYEGSVISYNRKGLKQSMINYKKGIKTGMAYYYFNNGKLSKQVEYLPKSVTGNQMLSTTGTMRVIFLQDSLGTVAVKDGNGHAREKVGGHKDGDELFEEGDYKDGVKDGVWIGKYTSGTKLSYTETFQQGKMIAGESIDNGKKYTYTNSETPPEFDGGKKGWSNFIASTTRYPKEAQENRISGTVLTSFVIDKDGRITDIKIVKSVHPLLDEEAKRVLQQSSRWTPGKYRGMPLKVVYTQSFKFSAS